MLVDFLREAFPELDELQTIEIERGIRFLKLRGWIDLLIGDLGIEVKKNLERERETGLIELRKYLLTRGPSTLGILTDERKFEVYKLADDHLEKFDEFEFHPDKPNEALMWLDSYLSQQKGILPTAEDIAFRFGLRSPVFKSAMDKLNSLWNKAKWEPTVRTKFDEWNALLCTVYGSEVGSEELFLRHTYLALLSRLLAFAVLQGRGPRGMKK